MKEYREKCHKLTNLIDNFTKNDIVVAFSGGVDSCLLLKIATECAKNNNTKVFAVTIHTMLHSVKETDFTIENAAKMGAVHKIIQTDELLEAGIEYNPRERCYLCKKHMFSKVCDFAKSVGADVVLDGTNFDDLHTYRPGIKALCELGIKSPLAEVEFTKAEVRKLAEEYGISASDKPSTPCLATRFAYGMKLEYSMLKKVEEAEEFIKKLGFYNVRVRVHNEVARIEVDASDISKLVLCRCEIIDFMNSLGFKYVTADLEGFVSGSMDK